MKRPLISTPILVLGAAFPLGVGGVIRQPLVHSSGTKRRALAFQSVTDQGR